MVRMICPECGKKSNDDIDDSGICKKCDEKWTEAQGQHKLSDFEDDKE
jgi:uncharacterized membrane protein YvbJ